MFKLRILRTNDQRKGVASATSCSSFTRRVHTRDVTFSTSAFWFHLNERTRIAYAHLSVIISNCDVAAIDTLGMRHTIMITFAPDAWMAGRKRLPALTQFFCLHHTWRMSRNKSGTSTATCLSRMLPLPATDSGHVATGAFLPIRRMFGRRQYLIILMMGRQAC